MSSKNDRFLISGHFPEKDIFAQYREQAEGMWEDGKPKKWYYAIPIMLFWAVVIGLIIRAFI